MEIKIQLWKFYDLIAKIQAEYPNCLTKMG
jgi:hypothetical protein